MASPTKAKETPTIRPCQKFEGHTDWVPGVIHLPDGRRIITCSMDGSLRVWNLKSGKQIGEDWRDEEDGWDEEDEEDGWNEEDWRDAVKSIALSPDEKTVASGSEDGAVRLWDIDTCKVIAKWRVHTGRVASVCWSQDGRRVLSGSFDGTARQWDVENRKTILEPIGTGHFLVWTAVYSPDMTLIVTGGRDGPSAEEPMECSIKIWDAKTSKLVATLKGHTWEVSCLAWTKDGKTLISGSFDFSIRTWNTQTWKQTAVLNEHGGLVKGIAISPNDRILASASLDHTARLWNLDSGQPISSPLQHSEGVLCISFSEDGKLLATTCESEIAYAWDAATIVREAGFNDLLLDSKANKLAFRAGATRNPVQRRPPAYRIPQGFFDEVPPNRSHSLARSHSRSSAQPGSTFITRLFHRNPSDNHDTSPFSPLEWVRNLLQLRGQSGEGTELQGRSPAVIEVPYAHGKRRNACAREKRKRLLLPRKNPTASSSQPSKPNTTQQSGTAIQTKPSLQPQPSVSNSSTTPAVGDNTAATTSVPSHPDVILRQAGLWTRFWLFIGCLSPEYQDGRH